MTMSIGPVFFNTKDAGERVARRRAAEAGAKAVLNRYTGSPGTVVEKVGAAAGGAAVGLA